MIDDELARRKEITFEQAEGIEPLPTQLALREIPQKLRAVLWAMVHGSLNACTDKYHISVVSPWRDILYAKHVMRDHRMADEFSPQLDRVIDDLKPTFQRGTYSDVLGLLQWLLRRPNCPLNRKVIAHSLEECRTAYRLVEGDTIVPIAVEESAQSITQTFSDLSAGSFLGCKEHLQMAGTELTLGNWANSIRESVHAVESIARTLEPSGELSVALSKLEKSARIHPAMKKGMLALYGFSSDEKGIRHPLLDTPAANVDESDALFMFGACAAFVSYLIRRTQSVTE